MSVSDTDGLGVTQDPAEKRLRAVLDQTPAACFEVDADGLCVFANLALRKLAGVGPDDLFGLGLWELIHLEDRERFADAWRDAAKRQVPFTMEARLKSPDGTVTWVSTSAGPMLGTDGAFTGYLGWVSDISNRMELEEYLERALMEQVKVSERIRRSEERFRLIVENTSEGICRIDVEHRVTFVNQRMADMLGHLPADLLERSLLDFVHPDAVDELRERLDERPEDRLLQEVVLQRSDGSALPAMVSAAPIGEGGARYGGLLAIITDLTGLRETEAQLHAVEQQFRSVFERAPLGISISSLDGRLCEVNQAMCEMTGYCAEDLIGTTGGDLLLDEDRELASREIVTQLLEKGGSHVSLELQLQRADGRVLWTMSDTSVVHGDDGKPLWLVTLTADINDRKVLEERLAHEASHDALTGVPNRAMMRELMQQSLARTERRGTQLALMFIDLDHFKQVNDTLGHGAGDNLLVQAVERIRGSLRLGDMVARHGGDEFVVLCEDIGGRDGALTVANRICDAMTAEFDLGDGVASIGASVGVALDDGSGDTDDLLRSADRALYEAKARGRGRAVLLEPADADARP